MSFTDISSPDIAGDGSRRVTWPEVAVLVAALAFDIYLMSRGLSVREATVTTISTVAGVLTVLLLPRRVAEAVKLIRAISRSVGASGSGSVPS
jgi:hypothetical protein